MKKAIKTITIDQELLAWVESMVESKEFGSVSHAIEKALVKLKKDYE